MDVCKMQQSPYRTRSPLCYGANFQQMPCTSSSPYGAPPQMVSTSFSPLASPNHSMSMTYVPGVSGFHHRPVPQPGRASTSEPLQRLRQKQAMTLQTVQDWVSGGFFTPPDTGGTFFQDDRPMSEAGTSVSGMTAMSAVSNFSGLSINTNLDDFGATENSAPTSNDVASQLQAAQEAEAETRSLLTACSEVCRDGQSLQALVSHIARISTLLKNYLAANPNFTQDLINLFVYVIGTEKMPSMAVHHAIDGLAVLLARDHSMAQWLLDQESEKPSPQRKLTIVSWMIARISKDMSGCPDYIGEVAAFLYLLCKVDGNPKSEQTTRFLKLVRRKRVTEALVKALANPKIDDSQKKNIIQLLLLIIKAKTYKEFAFSACCVLLVVIKNILAVPGDEPLLVAATMLVLFYIRSANKEYQHQFVQSKGREVCAGLLSHGSSRLVRSALQILLEISDQSIQPAENVDIILHSIIQILGTCDLELISSGTAVISNIVATSRGKASFLAYNKDSTRKLPAFDEMFRVLEYALQVLNNSPESNAYWQISMSIQENILCTFANMINTSAENRDRANAVIRYVSSNRELGVGALLASVLVSGRYHDGVMTEFFKLFRRLSAYSPDYYVAIVQPSMDDPKVPQMVPLLMDSFFRLLDAAASVAPMEEQTQPAEWTKRMERLSFTKDVLRDCIHRSPIMAQQAEAEIALYPPDIWIRRVVDFPPLFNQLLLLFEGIVVKFGPMSGKLRTALPLLHQIAVRWVQTCGYQGNLVLGILQCLEPSMYGAPGQPFNWAALSPPPPLPS